MCEIELTNVLTTVNPLSENVNLVWTTVNTKLTIIHADREFVCEL